MIRRLRRWLRGRRTKPPTHMAVVFSEPIRWDGVSSSGVVGVITADGEMVPGVTEVVGNTVTFTPDIAWAKQGRKR